MSWLSFDCSLRSFITLVVIHDKFALECLQDQSAFTSCMPETKSWDFTLKINDIIFIENAYHSHYIFLLTVAFGISFFSPVASFGFTTMSSQFRYILFVATLNFQKFLKKFCLYLPCLVCLLQYYTEPVTGYVFRSLKDCVRYINTGQISKHAFLPKNKQKSNTSSSDMESSVSLEAIYFIYCSLCLLPLFHFSFPFHFYLNVLL